MNSPFNDVRFSITPFYIVYLAYKTLDRKVISLKIDASFK